MTGPTSECTQREFGQNFNLETPVLLTTFVKINAVLYKPNMVVHIGQYEDNVPKFGLILYICCHDNKYILCVQSLLNHGFDPHFFAFRVELQEIFFSFPIESLESNRTSYLCSIKDKETYVNWL